MLTLTLTFIAELQLSSTDPLKTWSQTDAVDKDMQQKSRSESMKLSNNEHMHESHVFVSRDITA